MRESNDHGPIHVDNIVDFEADKGVGGGGGGRFRERRAQGGVE